MDSKVKKKLISVILDVEDGMWGEGTEFRVAGDLRKHLKPNWYSYDLNKVNNLALGDYLLKLLEFRHNKG